MEKKEWQGHDLWSPLTTLFLSFHRSVGSAEHALMSIDINMNFSRRITGILAHNFFELGKKKKKQTMWNLTVPHLQDHSAGKRVLSLHG